MRACALTHFHTSTYVCIHTGTCNHLLILANHIIICLGTCPWVHLLCLSGRCPRARTCVRETERVPASLHLDPNHTHTRAPHSHTCARARTHTRSHTHAPAHTPTPSDRKIQLCGFSCGDARRKEREVGLLCLSVNKACLSVYLSVSLSVCLSVTQ